MTREGYKDRPRSSLSQRALCRGIVLALFLIPAPAIDAQVEDNEDGQSWNLSLGANFLSRYISYGTDLSQDQPAFSFEAGIEHATGFSFGADAIVRTGSTGGYQQS